MRSAATILASVREQEARFELLTRALEQERRHVALQLERAQQPGTGGGQSLPMAWQQRVLQVRILEWVAISSTRALLNSVTEPMRVPWSTLIKR